MRFNPLGDIHVFKKKFNKQLGIFPLQLVPCAKKYLQGSEPHPLCPLFRNTQISFTFLKENNRKSAKQSNFFRYPSARTNSLSSLFSPSLSALGVTTL